MGLPRPLDTISPYAEMRQQNDVPYLWEVRLECLPMVRKLDNSSTSYFIKMQ